GSISEYQKNLKNVEKEISSKDLKTQLKNILFIREMLPHVLDEKKLATIDIYKYKNLKKLESLSLSEDIKPDKAVSFEELKALIINFKKIKSSYNDIQYFNNELSKANANISNINDKYEESTQIRDSIINEFKETLPELFIKDPYALELLIKHDKYTKTIDKIKSKANKVYNPLLKRIFKIGDKTVDSKLKELNKKFNELARVNDIIAITPKRLETQNNDKSIAEDKLKEANVICRNIDISKEEKRVIAVINKADISEDQKKELDTLFKDITGRSVSKKFENPEDTGYKPNGSGFKF
ncbi:MAG: hypothetical protein J0H68_09520, partial [Sphingobacteriia bacterium]|nr:hypothetical protein [Sphingobacteriia bacterium]